MLKISIQGYMDLDLTSIQFNKLENISTLASFIINMLKQQKRHSQTLGTKKSKPIEITLSKKGIQNNTTYNFGQENSNQCLEKGIKQGLSLVRPLKQKSPNIPQSQSFDLRTLKSRELRLKQEVCPPYKINWGNIPINNNNNSSRESQISSFLSSRQTIVEQLSHLIKKCQYQNYARQVHEAQDCNLPQFHMNIDESLQVIKEHQSTVTQQVKQGSSIDSVKSKIKGITKGFLRDGKNVSKQLQIQERKSSEVQSFMSLRDQNQSFGFQPSGLLVHQFQSQLVEQKTKESLPQKTIQLCQESQNDPSAQKALTQRSSIKQQYAQLQVRLEQCVEQIVEIQRNNNVETIVELELQILELKQAHQHEILQMKRYIEELQGRLDKKNSNLNHLSINNKSFNIEIKASTNQNISILQEKITSYQAQIKELRQKVPKITQSIHSPSFNCDASLLHKNRTSIQLQNQIYETEILKRKQSTLEQVLDLKKKKQLTRTLSSRSSLTNKFKKLYQIMIQPLKTLKKKIIKSLPLYFK